MGEVPKPWVKYYKPEKTPESLNYPDESLYSIVRTTATRYPERIAYEFEGRKTTYGQMLKKIDHLSIFILIAGTYTPVCVIAIDKPFGWIMLAAVWSIALAGIVFKLFYVTCPKWVSSVIYTAMGWVCIFALPQLLKSLTVGAFIWLLAGGILYSLGAVIYALRPKFLSHPRFGSHEVFHCFVLAGTFCHFIVVCGFLTRIG